jgi:hypothetical protein
MKKQLVIYFAILTVLVFSGCSKKTDFVSIPNIENSAKQNVVKDKKVDEAVSKLEGNWISTDKNNYHQTDATIKFINKQEFDIEINAFQLNSQGFPHTGDISGRGNVKGNDIAFTADEGDLKGRIEIRGDKLYIEYTGDINYYAGLNVSFATEFIKEKAKT